jgi:oxygen-independent coproporphyrinogen-3 oxidase
VEDYLALVNEGRLPLWKGHVLTKSDLIIRTHILNLMCRYETSWHKPEERFPGIEQAIERLEEMVADGLVSLSPGEVKATEQGKHFLRNICLCFDERYWNKIPAKQIFSTSA